MRIEIPGGGNVARRPRMYLATDLAIDLDLIAARRVPRQWIYLQGSRSWSRSEHDAVRAGASTCPVCGGSPRPSSRYCTLCDRAGLDDAVSYPGLDVDACPDPDYPREQPSYHEGHLKGGRGGRRR